MTRQIMRLLALGAALSALAACASPQELADADCRSWGAQPGTTAYTECMSSRVAAIEAGDLAAASMLVTTMPRTSSTYCNPAGTTCHTY